MKLVECIDGDWPLGGPKTGQICEVESEFKGTYYPEYTYYHISGYDFEMSSGKRIDFNSIYFREIQFPPSLEQEVKESLTRELQPV